MVCLCYELHLALFQNRFERPTLEFAQGLALHDLDKIAFLGGIALIVRIILVGAMNNLVVEAVAFGNVYCDDDGFVHLVTENAAYQPPTII
jgi:hypothetical protein